jgi:4-amino-4-deoxy-L-arabinose transferase-like glycosyltransferase
MFYAPYQLPWYAHPEITHEQFYKNSFARFVEPQTAGLRATGAKIAVELASKSFGKGGGTGASYEAMYDKELLSRLGNSNTAPVGAHNIYLSNMADYGIFGLFIFPAFILITLVRKNRISLNEINILCALMFLLAGLFSHNMLEQGWVFVMAILISLINNTKNPVDIKIINSSHK